MKQRKNDLTLYVICLNNNYTCSFSIAYEFIIIIRHRVLIDKCKLTYILRQTKRDLGLMFQLIIT